MAYGDYGGYAYRNGIRVDERSDYVDTGRSTVKSVPGTYPEVVFADQGLSTQQAAELYEDSPNGHAVLGEPPLLVGLYKQMTTRAWMGRREIVLARHVQNLDKAYITRDCLKVHEIVESGREEPVRFALPGGATLYVVWEETDNQYQYARLELSDTTVWTGWSGYGVGAGLEDEGYRYSTSQCDRRLKEIWPDAIAGVRS